MVNLLRNFVKNVMFIILVYVFIFIIYIFPFYPCIKNFKISVTYMQYIIIYYYTMYSVIYINRLVNN